MCTFSIITYVSNGKKLSEAGYKTRAELSEKEDCCIISFLYPDGREAFLVFIKGKEVTIAYLGTHGCPDMLADANAFFTVPAFYLKVEGCIKVFITHLKVLLKILNLYLNLRQKHKI